MAGESKITLQDGTGRYVSPRGDVFTGEWRDGAFRKGKCMFKNGDVYEGEWKYDVRHGKGKHTVRSARVPGGAVYEGVWVNGKLNGKGEAKYGDGGVYEGSFNDSLKHGEGTMVFANGDIYNGEWKKGGREGKGKMIYEFGDTYEGEWRGSLEHGSGKLTLENGTRYECVWEEGTRGREGTKTYKNGDVYTGTWMDGMEDGTGTIRFSDGGRYDGKFKSGKRHGYGTMLYKTGDSYEGEWSGGERCGHGKMLYQNGTMQEGEWVADEFQGLHIRQATAKDVNSIWEIDMEINFEEYDKETHELFLQETVVAVESGKVCGYMTTVMLDNRRSVNKMRKAYLDAVRGRKKDTLYVIDIAVTARSRGRGVGSALVAHAMQAHGSHRFVRYTAPAIKELHIVEKLVRGRGYTRADDIKKTGRYRDGSDAYSYVFARPGQHVDAGSDATSEAAVVSVATGKSTMRQEEKAVTKDDGETTELLDSGSEAAGSCDSQFCIEWEDEREDVTAAPAARTTKRGAAEPVRGGAKRSRGSAAGASSTGGV
jgi:ribosomal protein S18 acetylase RimI-like enzyme